MPPLFIWWEKRYNIIAIILSKWGGIPVHKFHTIIAWLILILLILHVLMASVTLLTPVFLLQSQFAYVFMGFVCVHAVLALWKVFRKKGARTFGQYIAENRNYWLRVLSGIFVLVLAFVHRTLWTIMTPFGVLPKSFDEISLIMQLLFVAAIGIHILLNIRPLLIDSGIDTDGRMHCWMKRMTAALLVLAVVGAVGYFMGAML